MHNKLFQTVTQIFNTEPVAGGTKNWPDVVPSKKPWMELMKPYRCKLFVAPIFKTICDNVVNMKQNATKMLKQWCQALSVCQSVPEQGCGWDILTTLPAAQERRVEVQT